MQYYYLILILSVWTLSTQAVRYAEDHAIVEGFEGQTVTLPCKARQNPENFAEGKVSWTKDDKDFSSDGRFNILPGHQLRISRVQKEDAGEYKCLIKAGGEEASEHSLLRVEGEPEAPVAVKVDCKTKAKEHIAILSWDINPIDFKAKNRITRYKIRVINKLNPTAWQTQFQSSDHVTVREIKLAPGAPYRFEIVAKNMDGQSLPAKSTQDCYF